jgi:hypothetical protein
MVRVGFNFYGAEKCNPRLQYMGNIFSVMRSNPFHGDPLLPVEFVTAGLSDPGETAGLDDKDLEEYYDKHHNSVIAEAYLWGII